MAAKTVLPPAHRREFEIAIICALPVESDAVEAIFDQFWDEDGDRYGKASGDQNAYTTGVIGNHNVVLAYMPGIGRGHAAKAAATFLSSFEGLKVALVVGVCGGIPTGNDGDRNLFLGDVVVSDDILVYDFGKKVPGNQYVHKSTLGDHSGRPSSEVRAFLTKVRNRKGRHQLEKRSLYHLSELQNETGEFQYPGIYHDRLFDPNYHHKHHENSCGICCETEACEKAQLSTCKELGCDESRIVSRPRLAEGITHTPSRIHFGRMASGDTVMKSGEDRDRIAVKQNVIAFEMEAAGVLNSLPCIIIKGVSDYADSHKDKSWQHYAAGAAAACMKALVEQWAKTDRFGHGASETVPDTISRGSKYVSESSDIDDTDSSRDGTQSDGEDQIKISKKLFQVLRAIEASFSSVLSCFKEFRRHLPRDVDVKLALRVQRDIFRTTLQNLLSQTHIPLRIAQDMVINANHPNWDDRLLQASILKHLDQSAAAWVEVVQAVHKALRRLESLTKDLKAASKRRLQDSPLSPGSLELKDTLQYVRLLVQNFSFLSQGEPPEQKSAMDSEPTKSSWEDLENFRAIQQAATSLHSMLERFCTSHAIHRVHLTLQPNLNQNMTQVNFNVSLRGYSPGLKLRSQLLWIDIESTIEPKEPQPGELTSANFTSLDQHRKYKLLGKDKIVSKKEGTSKKRVQFASQSKPTGTEDGKMASEHPDFALLGDFCTTAEQPQEFPGNHLGIFTDGGACKHALYSAKESYDLTSTCDPLSQLVWSSRSDLAGRLSLYQRIQLAKHLATAVLYYHATPWLEKSWGSEDIFFFTNEDEENNRSLRQAPRILSYIHTSVRSSGLRTPPASHCDERADVIHNPVLFSLGIMFLELAYQAPLSLLQDPIDGAPERSQGLVRFATARRLARKVHSIISVGFRRIVEKCLYCDFGHGNNFKNPALQQAFYRDIMVELEELEDFFRKLQHDNQD